MLNTNSKGANPLVACQHLAWDWHLAEWEWIVATHEYSLRTNLLADILQQIRVVHQAVNPDIGLRRPQVVLWGHSLGAVSHQVWTTVVSTPDASEQRQVSTAGVCEAETQPRMSYQDAGGKYGVHCQGSLARPRITISA